MKNLKTLFTLLSLCFIVFMAPMAFALTVTTNDIADGAVTDAKITGPISGSKLGAHTHSGAEISDGTITDAKISGPISASKISSTGLNADTVDGKHASDLADAVHTHSQSQVTGLEAGLTGKSDVTHNHDLLYQQKYGKVAVVAQTGGDYADPVAAVNNITTWCGTSSATNPCLLKIMPGIYTLGSTLMMPAFVDMEGSGENSSKIVGTVRYEYTTGNELRMLTVESAGNGIEMYGSSSLRIRDVSIVAGSYGINMAYSGNVTLRHVNISVSSASGEPTGIFSYYPYGDVLIEDSVISTTGSASAAALGVREFGGSMGGDGNLVIKNSKVTITPIGSPLYPGAYNAVVTGSELLSEGASDGVYCSASKSLTIKDSKLKAARYLFVGCANASAVNTMLDGGPIWQSTVKCFNAYDGNYNPFACQ